MHNLSLKRAGHEQGMTAISLVALLILGAVIILIGLRLFPPYMDNFKVSAHLKQLKQEEGILEQSDEEIASTFFKRLQIDDVSSVKPDNLFIEREGKDGLVLAVEYEVRTKALANIDMVISFSNEVTVN